MENCKEKYVISDTKDFTGFVIETSKGRLVNIDLNKKVDISNPLVILEVGTGEKVGEINFLSLILEKISELE